MEKIILPITYCMYYKNRGKIVKKMHQQINKMKMRNQIKHISVNYSYY